MKKQENIMPSPDRQQQLFMVESDQRFSVRTRCRSPNQQGGVEVADLSHHRQDIISAIDLLVTGI